MANGDKAIVFISCGQSSDDEIALGHAMASAVSSLTEHQGYFAEQVSSLDGLSNNILRELNQCVAFVAVMHHRGNVETRKGKHIRGSVWIEQEIAVAAFITQALQRSLPVRLYVQDGIKREGIRDQLQLNPVFFSTNDGVISDFNTWLGSGVLRNARALVTADANIRPNLQADLTTEFNQQNQTVWLSGKIRNVGKGVASEVRLFLAGIEGRKTYPAIVTGDPAKSFDFQLDTQQAFMHPPQFAALVVQYLDDDGIKYEQKGTIDFSGPDASGRYRYTLSGLGRPVQIQKFTMRFHPLEAE